MRKEPVTVIMVCCGLADTLRLTLPSFQHVFKHEGDRIIVATSPDDYETQRLCEEAGVACVLESPVVDAGDRFNKARMLNTAYEGVGKPGWVLFTDCDITIPKALAEQFLNDLNKDTLYYIARLRTVEARLLPGFCVFFNSQLKGVQHLDSNDKAPLGYFQLFHTEARAALEAGARPLDETCRTAAELDWKFSNKWEDRTIMLPLAVLHLDHGMPGGRWCGVGGFKGVVAAVRDIERSKPFIKELQHRGGGMVGVEVGTYAGFFLKLLAESGCFKQLTGVDQWVEGYCPGDWASDSDMGKAEEMARRVEESFDSVNLMKCSSREASKRFDEESLDMVYIDADHTYKAVRSDILAWFCKIKDGGLLAGHDYNDMANHPGVTKAVKETIGNPDIVFPCSSWAITMTTEIRRRLNRRRKKIFQIGFNRTATRSIKGALDAAGIKAVHYDRGYLSGRMWARLDAGEDPIQDYIDFDAFLDTENIQDGFTAGLWLPVYTRFKEIYEWHPDALYILNLRNVDDWIGSRHRHREGYTEAFYPVFNVSSQEEVFDCWRTMYDEHIANVREFFKDKPNFYEWHLEDGFDGLAEFLDIDVSCFPHIGRSTITGPLTKDDLKNAG